MHNKYVDSMQGTQSSTTEHGTIQN